MPLPTKAQCAVITAASEQHLLVDAGAGSGKTTTVVQTVCHQLGIPVLGHDGKPLPPVASPLTLEQVAAITFTNQAAADLKRKLRAALRSAGRAELASDVDAARIGTIHGFCGDLMRDHALRARLRPGHRVLSDGEARVLVAECARTELHAAIGAGDVEGLDALLVLRRLKDITEWVTRAAGDSDRLERWAARADAERLRDHERALLEIARRASARRNAHLESEGLIDFDRMLVAARDLLRDTDVRRAVQRRLRLLVVDEFQDVDPVQRDIAELLGAIAEHEDPEPTRIILVGDPKQSIYRFRRADVTLWNEMARKFRDDDFPGTVLPLSENFRSKAAILGFVDHTIGAMLDTPLDIEARRGFEVDYTPLKPAAPNHGGDRAVELLLVPAAPDGKPMNANAVRELDSAGVAQRITELHAEGRAYGDMAILLAAWSDVEMYEGALRLAGIPVYVQRGEGFWSRREVLDCVLALRAIRDPGDDIAVVGFLKSPFVGVRDETLMALARARGDGALSGAITSVPHEKDLLARADRLLRTFGALRDRLDTAELLRRLLADSGYMAVAALEGDGPQCVANLRKLIRLAGVSSNQSLGEFLREVQDSRDREDKVALEPLYRERGDVVTITSIHGAKGLEWPVVFWSDLVRGAQGEKGPICTGRDTFSIEAESKDARHDALQWAVAQEGIAETLRLWYVAATRAKERLILTGLPLGERRKPATSPAQRILAALTGDGDGEDDVPGEDAAPRAVVIVDPADDEIAYESATGETYHAVVRVLGDSFVPLAEVQESVPALPVRPAVVPAVAGAARLSASQLMSFAHDPAQWRRDYVERTPFHAAGGGAGTGAGGIGRGAMRAIVAGQVVHDVLERIGNDDVDIGALIEDAICERDEEAPGRESDAGVALRAALRERVDAALASADWQEVAGAPGAERELWFTRILTDGTVIQGALDLAAPAPAHGSGTRADAADDGIRILDVKTGAAGGDLLAKRYEVQAAVYVDAVRAITGRSEVSFALLSLPSGDVVEISPTTDVGALVQRLRTLPRPAAKDISQAC